MFASSFAKVNALFSLSLMLWQLHLVDREREREREREKKSDVSEEKKIFFFFFFGSHFFSPLF